VLIDDDERDGLAAFVWHFDNLGHVVFAPLPEHLLGLGEGGLVCAFEAEDIDDEEADPVVCLPAGAARAFCDLSLDLAQNISGRRL
jgi:hypothetical protein